MHFLCPLNFVSVILHAQSEIVFLTLEWETLILHIHAYLACCHYHLQGSSVRRKCQRGRRFNTSQNNTPWHPGGLADPQGQKTIWLQLGCDLFYLKSFPCPLSWVWQFLGDFVCLFVFPEKSFSKSIDQRNPSSFPKPEKLGRIWNVRF